jgi:hypothetical protein
MLAQVLGRWDEAEAHFEDAIRDNRRAAEILVHSQVGTAVHNTFRREGDVSTVAFEGTSVLIKDSRGLRDIAQLLARPGLERHVRDLISAATPRTAVRRKLRTCESRATWIRCWIGRRDGRIASS